MKLKKLIRRLMSRLRSTKYHSDEVPSETRQSETTHKKRKFFGKNLRKFISRRHKLPRYRKFDSETANPAKKTVRFANVQINKDNEIDGAAALNSSRKNAKKRKRLRSLKRQARKAVEYLALGIAASGAGYGMPPGFNPSAFKSECPVYPEVYTLEQLRWMSNYQKNLYSMGQLAV